MSGHSKWAQIKHKKAKVDARRGQLFSKLIREITIAARLGGGNPEDNPRLRSAIEAAKAANMPKENIERAIKRGTGELGGGEALEEVYYEGYGPNGVALLVKVVTDNRNRTTAAIRHVFSKYGGNLGSAGCVAWMFQDKGLIYIDKSNATDEDTLLGLALEAGAEDVRDEGDTFAIVTAPQELHQVKEFLVEHGVEVKSAELTKIPQSTIKLDEATAFKVLRLVEKLEELDDVQQVYANFDIPDEVMHKIAESMAAGV